MQVSSRKVPNLSKLFYRDGFFVSRWKKGFKKQVSKGQPLVLNPNAEKQHQGECLSSKRQKQKPNYQLKANHVSRSDAAAEEAAMVIKSWQVFSIMACFRSRVKMSKHVMDLLSSLEKDRKSVESIDSHWREKQLRLPSGSPNLTHTADKLCNDAIQRVAIRNTWYLGQLQFPHGAKQFEFWQTTLAHI